MSKKIIALFVLVVFLFCASSCEKNDIHTSQSANKKTPYKDTFNSSHHSSISEQPAHTHSYSDATCISPKTCSCGATLGTSLKHQFSSATCITPKTCERCGTTEGDLLPHNYINNQCSLCGQTNPDSLPVELNKIHVIDANSNFYKYDENSFQDTYGNTYIGVYIWGAHHSGIETVVYNLNKQYKTFTGSIVTSPRLESCAYADYYIYADDRLVYSFTQQEKTTAKIDFEVNIENATTLSIRAGAYKKPQVIASGYMGCACIVDAKLNK